MFRVLMLGTGVEEALLIAALLGTAATIGTTIYAEGQKPEIDAPEIGPDPGKIPTPDSAAIRRALKLRRDRASLRVNPPASETGLQIP